MPIKTTLAACLLAVTTVLAAGANAATVRTAPVDPDATPKTRAIYSYLRATWGKAVIAGQADLSWDDSIDMAERVHADTGKYPALIGYDFMDYGRTGAGLSGQHQVEEAIAFAARGGLVAFHWHWRDPSLLRTDRVNQAQFYAGGDDPARRTGFTIPMANGDLDRNSPAFAQLDDGIDLVAAQLRRLQDAGVTVLWRPLHEAAGSDGQGWFWWGRARSDGESAAAAHIALWRHLYDRLVHVHGLHNLIWVWNGQDARWYPGDDVVDIAGYDIYDTTDNRSYRSQLATYRKTAAMTGEPKPVALTETSYIPDPDAMASDGAWWLWFMVWNDGSGPAGVSNADNFWTGEQYNSNAHKIKVYQHPNVITLDKLPRF
ncbi:beta-mannosidase [Duganella sp. Leaf126]|uniref:glycosyl hydrolase n=1 Tax=Duganella sp. Leaf126 TaxID=1736266 RepID=UPI0006F9C8D3|nr:glycosyl hydrolase [Duganella sp. Leaf126]KQQ47535.1 beta-mannosidase [Duganella sp. Leaf126]